MDAFVILEYKDIPQPECRPAIHMARILYGVMGNTYGHVARALAIVSRLPEHEFHFVGGGRVTELLAKNHAVLEVPVKRTIHKNHRVSIPATTAQLALCVMERSAVRRQICELIQRWQPDLAISDREIFLPLAARDAGLECVGLDHSHILSACDYPVPVSQLFSRSLALLEDALFFNATRHNFIVSFFHPPLKHVANTTNELLPPILRPEVREIQPTFGGHILIYQTNPTFLPLIEAARQLKRPVIAYGFRNQRSTEGNITFKPFHPQAILEDLASCAYAVVNGGHNLICEALAYQKPVFCFPITGQFEQFLNAWHVRELGFGDFSTSRRPTPALFNQFETRLDECRDNIQKKFRDGSDIVIDRVRGLIEQKMRANKAFVTI